MRMKRAAEGRGRDARRLRIATEEAWHRRDRATSAPQRELLVSVMRGQEYGIDIAHINEIIKVRPPTEVPRVPPFILGVISVRGVVLPVIDLKRRLGGDGVTDLSPQARYLIVTRDDEMFGLLVDGVRQVVRIGEDAIEPPLAGSGEGDFIAGIGRLERRMVVLLDLDAILRFEVRKRRAR